MGLGEAVATVGGKPITRAALQHWMATSGEVKQEVPEPPDYTACATHLQASGKAHARQTPAQLKDECRRQYQELMAPALNSVIHAQWLIGEGRDEGLRVSSAAVQRELAQSKQPGLEFEQTLARTGQSLSDVKFKIRLNQLSSLLYEAVKRRTPKVSTARISSYYQTHKQSYAVPELRDLHIIRTSTDAGARKALGEIKAGGSFAGVVKRFPEAQPRGAKAGLVLGLQPKEFAEPPLNDAIFKAHPNVLSGPVKIALGYYVFEVTRITPPHQQTLGETKATIAQLLPEVLHSQTLTAFTKAFKAKWIARTDCRAGYVVEDCRQWGKARPSGDAYTF